MAKKRKGKRNDEDENDGDFEGVVGEEGEMMRAKNFEMGGGTTSSS